MGDDNYSIPVSQGVVYNTLTSGNHSSDSSYVIKGSGYSGSQTNATKFLKEDGSWSIPENTTYLKATSSDLGLIRLGNDNLISSSSNNVYPIQLDSYDKAYVYVPWENTNTTYQLTLNGTTNGGGTSLGTLYAPTSKGNEDQILIADNSGIPTWANQSSLSVGSATKLAGNDTYTAWKQTYWENGLPKTIKGDLDDVGRIYFKENSNHSVLYLEAYRSEFRDSNNTIIGYSDGLHLKKSNTIDNDVRYFAFEAYKDENTSRRESKILMFDTNIIDYEPNIANSGLSLGYGSRGIVTTNLSGKDISMWVYDPDSITANNNNPAKEVLKLVASTNETSGISAFQTYLPQATQASSGLRIGNAILYWDSQNDALALCKYNGTENPSPGNFYATGGVSALGLSPGSGSGSVPAMTFGNLTVNNKLSFNSSGANIIANQATILGRSSQDINNAKCINLFYDYDNSKIRNNSYYYNLYTDVGLKGETYVDNAYTNTWSIDPDGCAKFSRVYLSDNAYIYFDSNNVKLKIGTNTYTLTKQ